jgi:hypothetical protein
VPLGEILRIQVGALAGASDHTSSLVEPFDSDAQAHLRRVIMIGTDKFRTPKSNVSLIAAACLTLGVLNSIRFSSLRPGTHFYGWQSTHVDFKLHELNVKNAFLHLKSSIGAVYL